MKMIYKAGLALALLVTSSLSLFAQNNFFSDANEKTMTLGNSKRVLVPQRYRALGASVNQLRSFLWSLPAENTLANRHNAPVMELPMPDGSVQRFRVWESSIQEPALQAKFPDIKTFLGQGIDDAAATVRLDFSPYFGFHAQVLSPNGDVYIDPYARGNVDYYISYNTHDNIRNTGFFCQATEEILGTAGRGASTTASGPCRGTQLYVYRLAIANTGEYAQAVGGTTAASLHAAIVTTVNRVVGIYEKELAVRMVLVANNNLVEFLDPNSDPFSGNNNANTLINESQTVISGSIGSANFDIGHTFSTGGGGLAGLGVVCNTSNKARGITGSPFPIGDAYDVDYVAHEMGHQFGGSHTFNSIAGGNCTTGTRSASQAYEVGSGTTIQAYAGICGSDNIQPNSDPYFHAVSFDQISTYLENGGTCRTLINTGNTLPVITAMNNNGASIPTGTPFTLTATATDADGDAITYNWEQWDRTSTGGAWNSGATSTGSPLFKSRIPKASGSRTFPDMSVILAGYPSNPAAAMNGLKGETLPTVGRTMNFKLTVRDNRAAGGGVVSGGDGCQGNMTGLFTINVIGGTGPFLVTVPNGGESYQVGSTQTVTWDVANTTAAPVSTANVKITLSTDGGLTYPIVLAASTPNDGNEPVVIPSNITSTARVRVEAIGNIFFDISNNNFSIVAAAVGFDFNSPAAASLGCATASSSVINLGTVSNGGFTTPITLSASGVPAGTTVSFSSNPVTPGNSTNVTLNNANVLPQGTYNITINGVAGSVTRSRVLTFTVNPGAGPAITTQPASQSVCETGNVSFNAVGAASPNGQAPTYQWQISNNGGASWANLPGETGSSISLSALVPSQSGNQFRVLVTGQCNTSTSNAAVLTVSPRPVLVADSTTAIMPGGKTTLRIQTSAPLPPGAIIRWYRNGVLLPNVTGNTLEVTVASLGDYTADISYNGITCSTLPISVTAQAIGDLFIYPVPNNGSFQIFYVNPGTPSQQNVLVYDARGALVYRSGPHTVAGSNTVISVNMPTAASGMYLVILTDSSNSKIASAKIWVQGNK